MRGAADALKESLAFGDRLVAFLSTHGYKTDLVTALSPDMRAYLQGLTGQSQFGLNQQAPWMR